MTTVTLLGDSVLDNFFWLSDREKDLTYDLGLMGYRVCNLAVDESCLSNVVNSIVPNETYRNSRQYPYLCNDQGIMEPLRLLKPCDIVVLSVGGNDFRRNLSNLLFGIDKFLAMVINPEFIKTFDGLLSTLRTQAKKVILVCVYAPYLGTGSQYQLMAPFKDGVYDKIRIFLQYLCKRHNIALLDLSRTFNPYDRTHYGTTEIEPSNKSSHCIAECIRYIDQNYQGYHTYYAPNCEISKIVREG
jgi:hypothetical protein